MSPLRPKSESEVRDGNRLKYRATKITIQVTLFMIGPLRPRGSFLCGPNPIVMKRSIDSIQVKTIDRRQNKMF